MSRARRKDRQRQDTDRFRFLGVLGVPERLLAIDMLAPPDGGRGDRIDAMQVFRTPFFAVASASVKAYDTFMDDVSRQWAERAQYDLDTADVMFKAGRYLYVLFCCQQAVEKVLKALIVKRTGELPPRIHNLPRLAEVAGLETVHEQVRFMGELSSYYIQSRYPEEMKAMGSAVSQELAREVLGKTEQTITWVLSILR